MCKCVLYYCHRVTTQLQLTNIYITEPTSTDRIIPTGSCHPFDHQFAASWFLIHLINSFSLNPVDKEKETSIVQNILHSNSYIVTLISSLIPFHNRPHHRKLSEPKRRKIFSYVRNETILIIKLFRHTNLKIIFRTKNSVETFIKNNTFFGNIFIFRSIPVDLPLLSFGICWPEWQNFFNSIRRTITLFSHL